MVAIGWANSPWSEGYSALKSFELGPESLHLHLSLGEWGDLLSGWAIATATDSLDVRSLLLALVPVALFGLLVQRRITHWWLLIPIALLAWALVHASGIHATVAGVLLAVLVPVRRGPRDDASEPGPAIRIEHRLHPLSAGLAVPVFAFLATGFNFMGDGPGGGATAALRDPAALGVMVALVVGKAIGVFGGTWVFARFTRAELAVLAGSLTAAALSAAVLLRRNRVYRQINLDEQRDDDGDGVPDMFRAGTG